MIGSSTTNTNNLNNWDRFKNYLWYNDELKIWLDISKVNFEDKQFELFKKRFSEVFKSIDKLEKGHVSNISENRQVGHYWLRNSSIAPEEAIKENIDNEVLDIKNFGGKILNGEIINNSGEKFKNVLWVGIGGSALGPLLIIESLQKDLKGLNFYFIDNIDPFLISETLSKLKNELSRTLIVIVSKSGGTPEPRIAMDLIRREFENKGLIFPLQTIAITMNDSNLYKKAKTEKWLKIFNLPDWVGGRTSITSSVGLLPLSLIDENLDSFLEGSAVMDNVTRSKDVNNNPAALLAISWYFCGDGLGKRDMVVLPYRDRLQVFSKYLQQLVMESLGKKYDRSGNLVNQGITVFGNKGSTDQHAYVQQLRDGLDNFFCVFIELLDFPEHIPHNEFENPKDYLSGFLQGTRSALSCEGRQSITITMNKLSPYSLGALIALFERAVSFYAELVDINAYDQPGVEAGKKAAAVVIDTQQRIKKILFNESTISFTEIINNLEVTDKEIRKETVFFILRQMCFENKLFIVLGSWSDPSSLIFKRK